MLPNTYESPSHPLGEGPEQLDRPGIVTRRRRALMILVGGALASLVALVLFGGTWLVALHAAADTLLVWYLVMLRRIATARHQLVSSASDIDDEMREMSRVRVVQSS